MESNETSNSQERNTTPTSAFERMSSLSETRQDHEQLKQQLEQLLSMFATSVTGLKTDLAEMRHSLASVQLSLSHLAKASGGNGGTLADLRKFCESGRNQSAQEHQSLERQLLGLSQRHLAVEQRLAHQESLFREQYHPPAWVEKLGRSFKG